ncbi:hypothetical protein, partial [Klebsiella quasipneumoniae]
MTDIRASANTVEAAAQELDQQTSQASHKMDGHCLETDKVVAAVTEMSATAREVASNTYSTAQAIESANSQIAVAQKEVNLAIDGIGELVNEVNQTSAAVGDLSQQAA